MTISTETIRFAGLPVQKFTADIDAPADPGTVAWKIATDWEGGSDRFVADLAALAAAPWAGQVTALILGQWSDSSDPLPVAEITPHLGAFPALTALFVGDMTFEESEISWIDWGDLDPVLSAFPNLTTLHLRGGCTPMDDASPGLVTPTLPGLTSLTVESGGLLEVHLAALLAGDHPALDHLELWLGTQDYGGIENIAPLTALLAGDLFPTVTRLGLRNSEHADEIAAALVGSPLLDRVTHLDLSLGVLTDTGVDALTDTAVGALAAGGLGAVTTLNLDRHYATEAALARLRAAHPGVAISADDPQDPDDDFRYPAVSE